MGESADGAKCANGMALQKSAQGQGASTMSPTDRMSGKREELTLGAGAAAASEGEGMAALFWAVTGGIGAAAGAGITAGAGCKLHAALVASAGGSAQQKT